MWFKNLTIYRLPEGWSRTAAEIETTLTEFPLKPCVGQALQTRGWVPINDAGQMAYGQEKQVLIALGTEEKLLPASVVNQTADEKIRALEQQKGFKIGRKHKREIKEQIQAELLPRAFSRRRVTLGWLDFSGGWLVVDTSTPSRADDFTQALRDALGELPATPMQSEPSMGALLTQWLSSMQAPGAFDLDDECELTSTDENKSTVRYLHHALDGKDIANHLSHGKVVTRLSLTWNGRISLLINDKLQVKRLKFLDIERVREEQDGLDAEAEFEANFTLMSGEYSALLKDLATAINAPRD
ncbi:recombination-associated protein RdgC [Sinimarinibacterium sp. CAU 1509]|uniref:recombination-associated protein RdgC n=1 Tax=Sinimarinibacterium sp. CAU 1509 TaxID=2562283 RepID=UPI0010AC49AA|nr:recombination-associated protein RdgC [Sinimarinibacterium sp. CAU 1509]TJY64943.1 recombination-associated protein RdgC [Sinimarinibacterium sp. CAU 1509]